MSIVVEEWGGDIAVQILSTQSSLTRLLQECCVYIANIGHSKLHLTRLGQVQVGVGVTVSWQGSAQSDLSVAFSSAKNERLL